MSVYYHLKIQNKSKTKQYTGNGPNLRPSPAHRTRSRGDQHRTTAPADNQRLRNELATAKANLGNRYLRSVLNLIDKHRALGSTSDWLYDDYLVLHDNGFGTDGMMREQLYQFPLEDKLAIIPVLRGLGYWVMHDSNINRNFPFMVRWNTTEERLRRDHYDFFTRGGVLHRPTE